MSVKSKMTAIADPIRTLMGKTDTMGLDAMANHLGNAVNEVDNQNGIIQELKNAIAENVSKTSSEVSEQTDLIQQIKTALEGKAGGGSVADPVIEPLEVTENGTYTAPEGVDGYSPVMVNVPKNAGMVVKSGTTTSRTINTGLSSIQEFFIYKESLNTTGLIHLYYSKTGGTSYLHASAWSTNNYGTKTIANATTAATVSGGSITIPGSSVTTGGLSTNITYKWIAVGTE